MTTEELNNRGTIIFWKLVIACAVSSYVSYEIYEWLHGTVRYAKAFDITPVAAYTSSIVGTIVFFAVLLPKQLWWLIVWISSMIFGIGKRANVRRLKKIFGKDADRKFIDAGLSWLSADKRDVADGKTRSFDYTPPDLKWLNKEQTCLEMKNINPRIEDLGAYRSRLENWSRRKIDIIRSSQKHSSNTFEIVFRNLPAFVQYEFKKVDPGKQQIGISSAGEPCIYDHGKIPSLFITGRTGSGKTASTISIVENYFRLYPDLEVVLVDPKLGDDLKGSVAFKTLVKEERIQIINPITEEIDLILPVFEQLSKDYQSYNDLRAANRHAESLEFVKPVLIIMDEMPQYLGKSTNKDAAKKATAIIDAMNRFAALYRSICDNNREAGVGFHLLALSQLADKESLNGLQVRTNFAILSHNLEASISKNTFGSDIAAVKEGESGLKTGEFVFNAPGDAAPTILKMPYDKDWDPKGGTN